MCCRLDTGARTYVEHYAPESGMCHMYSTNQAGSKGRNNIQARHRRVQLIGNDLPIVWIRNSKISTTLYTNKKFSVFTLGNLSNITQCLVKHSLY